MYIFQLFNLIVFSTLTSLDHFHMASVLSWPWHSLVLVLFPVLIVLLHHIVLLCALLQMQAISALPLPVPVHLFLRSQSWLRPSFNTICRGLGSVRLGLGLGCWLHRYLVGVTARQAKKAGFKQFIFGVFSFRNTSGLSNINIDNVLGATSKTWLLLKTKMISLLCEWASSCLYLLAS